MKLLPEPPCSAASVAPGPSTPQPRDSLRARPPFQTLCDGRAAPPQQEDAFVRGHGAVKGPRPACPSPPPPAIKHVPGHLQPPPSLGSARLAPRGPGMAPRAPGAAPASPKAHQEGDGPARAGARGLSPYRGRCHGASGAVRALSRGWGRPRDRHPPGVRWSGGSSSSVRLLQLPARSRRQLEGRAGAGSPSGGSGSCRAAAGASPGVLPKAPITLPPQGRAAQRDGHRQLLPTRAGRTRPRRAHPRTCPCIEVSQAQGRARLLRPGTTAQDGAAMLPWAHIAALGPASTPGRAAAPGTASPSSSSTRCHQPCGKQRPAERGRGRWQQVPGRGWAEAAALPRLEVLGTCN